MPYPLPTETVSITSTGGLLNRILASCIARSEDNFYSNDMQSLDAPEYLPSGSTKHSGKECLSTFNLR